MRSVTSGTRYYSFSVGQLCVREPGTVAELERVRYTAKVEPVAVEFWLRTVDDEARGGGYDSFISANGKPPRYRGDTRYAGTHTQDIAGTTITQSCDDANGSGGFTSLILAMNVDQRGANVPGVAIDYRVDGDPYTLNTEWRMIACGSAVMVENCSLPDRRPG